MTVLFTDPSTSAFSQNMDAPEGAKLYFYQPGTTTPIKTYTTSVLDVEHPHPVVADGKGRFPVIYINENTYKAVLKDKDDNLEWSEDNIKNVFDSVIYQKAEFTSTTNGGDFPGSGDRGDEYRVGEAFTTNAASGSALLRIGNMIRANKDAADGIAADWDIQSGDPPDSSITLAKLESNLIVLDRVAHVVTGTTFATSADYTIPEYYSAIAASVTPRATSSDISGIAMIGGPQPDSVGETCMCDIRYKIGSGGSWVSITGTQAARTRWAGGGYGPPMTIPFKFSPNTTNIVYIGIFIWSLGAYVARLGSGQHEQQIIAYEEFNT